MKHKKKIVMYPIDVIWIGILIMTVIMVGIIGYQKQKDGDSRNYSTDSLVKIRETDSVPAGYVKLTDMEKRLESIISFRYAYPNIIFLDMDGAVISGLPLNSYLFLKRVDPGKKQEQPLLTYEEYIAETGLSEKENIYIDSLSIEKYIKRGNEIKEEREKIYQFGDSIKKEAENLIGGSTYIGVCFKRAYETKEYQNKTAPEGKKFFILELESASTELIETEWDWKWEKRNVNIFTKTEGRILQKIISETKQEYEEYTFYKEERSYCFKIDDSAEIKYAIIGVDGYIAIGENFSRVLQINYRSCL